MAVWDFKIDLVPISGIERHHCANIPEVLDGYGTVDLNKEFDLNKSYLNYWEHLGLPQKLVDVPHGFQETEYWMDDGKAYINNGIKIELSDNEFHIRIDCRKRDESALDIVIDLARKHECVIVLKGGYFIEPDMNILLNEFKSSVGYRFSKNPEVTLKQMSLNNDVQSVTVKVKSKLSLWEKLKLKIQSIFQL